MRFENFYLGWSVYSFEGLDGWTVTALKGNQELQSKTHASFVLAWDEITNMIDERECNDAKTCLR
jgi:hypothetical protein